MLAISWGGCLFHCCAGSVELSSALLDLASAGRAGDKVKFGKNFSSGPGDGGGGGYLSESGESGEAQALSAW